MADQFIIIDEPAVTDKKLDTTELTVGANTVQRERVNIAGATATAIAPVDGTKGLAVDLTATGSNTNKLLVTPDSVALPANQSCNVAQLAGTTTDTNSGSKSAGTLRVVIATDQPALTNKLLVTPDSVALPANQSVNVAQINATTPLMDNGASGSGAARVTIANNSTGILAQVTLVPTVTTVSTVTTLSTLTGGGVADAAADSGNPVKVGGKALVSPKGMTILADGNRANLSADADSALRVKGWTTGQDLISTTQSVTATTSTAATNFSAVAATKNFITSVTIHNAHATSNCFVRLQDGSGGSDIWVFPAPATGGATHNFDPPLKQPTANTALYFASSAAITTIYVSINGFQSKAY